MPRGNPLFCRPGALKLINTLAIPSRAGTPYLLQRNQKVGQGASKACVKESTARAAPRSAAASLRAKTINIALTSPHWRLSVFVALIIESRQSEIEGNLCSHPQFLLFVVAAQRNFKLRRSSHEELVEKPAKARLKTDSTS